MFTAIKPKELKEANKRRRDEIKWCKDRIRTLRMELNSGNTRPWALLIMEKGYWSYDSWRTFSSARGAIKYSLSERTAVQNKRLCLINMMTLEHYDGDYLKLCEALKLEGNIWAVRSAKGEGDEYVPKELSGTQAEEA